MSITTKLGLFLLLLLGQYTSALSFELDVLICKKKCRAQQQKDLAQCDKDCLQQYTDWAEKEKTREEENIFVFHDVLSMTSIVDDDDGYMLVLQRLERRSDVFQGIQNYRLVASRVNPSTFLSPSHRNVDSVVVVANGRASITLIHQGNKETHNVKFGDIIRIRAGTIVHYVNPDDDLQLFHTFELTVNIPDYFEYFFVAGSNNNHSYCGPLKNNLESFYSAFSDEVLQAAFNTDRDEARKLFQGRNDSVFVKVSQEQIKALLSDQFFLESGNQQFSTPYNIFNQDPSYSNKYGKLYEIKPQDYQQIQDLDIQLTYTNITKGAMFGPYYNTRSAAFAIVIKGSGYFQVACPHLSQQPGASYNASAKLLTGDKFVVPAGHPIVIVNSGDGNLEVLYFEVNTRVNQRIPLAGMNNVLKQLSKEVKQLSFNMSSEQVNDIFDKQKESWFFPGPGQQSDRAST